MTTGGGKTSASPLGAAFRSWVPNRPRFLLALGLPLVMGGTYLAWARAEIVMSNRAVLLHVVTVLFWTLSTVLAYGLAARLLARLGAGAADRVSALVPALSYLALMIIYAGGVIGIVSWGEPMNLPILRYALPDIFNLSRAQSLPLAAPIAALIAPPLVFLVLFQVGRIRWCRGGGAPAPPPGGPARRLRYLITALWLSLAAFGVVNWARPGACYGEPVYDFFLAKHPIFTMSGQRSEAAVQDLIARGGLPKQTPRVRNVILFIVDDLRFDRISLDGYERLTDPFLRSLAREMHFHRVETVLANGSESRGGILATLTSKDISELSHLSYTLSDYLVDQGFESTMILSGDHSWYNLAKGYGKTIHRLVDGGMVKGPHGVFDDELLVSEAAALPMAGDRRHFFYFHLMSVHELGYLYPEFRAAPVPLAGNGRADEANAARPTADYPASLYDRRIRQADDIIRRVMAQLRAKGYLDDALCVVTADHGEVLNTAGLRGHGRSMAREALQIPLLFFASGALPAFQRSDYCVQLDIAPTIVDLIGLQIPSSWEGHSLCRGPTSPWSYHQGTFRYKKRENAVVYRVPPRVLKYSFAVTRPDDEDEQTLYDLISDPEEQRNLLRSPEIPAGLLQDIRAHAHAHFAPEPAPR